jgi:predicted ATPase/class 3 adenylate cyclase
MGISRQVDRDEGPVEASAGGRALTFLFTDIEGSTRLWEGHPEAMQEALARHDAMLRGAITAHGGRVFKTLGDSFCACFGSAGDALASAVEVQREMFAARGTWEPIGSIDVRVVLHCGPAQERDGDFFGQTLNRASRLLAAAHGGQILVSSSVRDALVDVTRGLPARVVLKDLGPHRLRDLREPEHIYQVVHPELPGEFGPLRTLAVLPNNLPVQLTSFVGREAQMGVVKQLLRSPYTRLLTLTGPGGCGKTRLALQVAADLLDEFGDGVYWVELAPLAHAALVPDAVALALGVREDGDAAVPLARTLAEHLRTKSLLLILDNCEHVVAAAAMLAEGLLKNCPRVRVLATSREALGVAGETPYLVPSLTMPPDEEGLGLGFGPMASDVLPGTASAVGGGPQTLTDLANYESIRLFVDRASTLVSSFALTNENAEDVSQVCRRLDGIPLAIELAAARVKVLSPKQIAARLDDRFRLLTGGNRTALPRQQTLRALIDWSYDLLSDHERELLMRLSVFAGGWDLEACDAVCLQSMPSHGGESEGGSGNGHSRDGAAMELLDLFSQLVDKSLVMANQTDGMPRYRLLETVRQYCAERLHQAGLTAVVKDRHRDHFLALAEAAQKEFQGPRGAQWFGRMRVEHDNVRKALEWCERNDQSAVAAERGLRIAAAMSYFWMTQGHQRDGRRRLAAALGHPQAGAAPAARRAAAQYEAGLLAWADSDLNGAGEFFEQSLAIRRELADDVGVAKCLTGFGMVAREREDWAGAESFFSQALEYHRRAGNGIGEAGNLNDLGTLARRRGDLESARGMILRALEINRRLGNEAWQAVNHSYLALIAAATGDVVSSRQFCEQTMSISRRLGRRIGVARALECWGYWAAAQGQAERAARFYGAAETLRHALGAPLIQSETRELDEGVPVARSSLVGTPAWEEGRGWTVERSVAEVKAEG